MVYVFVACLKRSFPLKRERERERAIGYTLRAGRLDKIILSTCAREERGGESRTVTGKGIAHFAANEKMCSNEVDVANG